MLDLASSVQIRPETGKMTVVAGDSLSQQITITNSTGQQDTFELRMDGLPGGWFSFSRSSLTLFQNWSDSVTLTVVVGEKTRPDRYFGKLIATSTGQPGVRGEFDLEIEVLPPLRLDARLQPRRATGFKARYNLILHNHSMCEGLIDLSLIEPDDCCEGLFPDMPVRIAPSQVLVVPFKVQMKPDASREEARNTHNFEVQVNPQWNVNDKPVHKPPESAKGEYQPRSRWDFVLKHPWLFIVPLILLVLLVIWLVLVQPWLQGNLTGLVNRTGPVKIEGNSIRVEQNNLNAQIQNQINPLAAFVKVETRFLEKNQETQFIINYIGFSSTITGTLSINPKTGDLEFSGPKTNNFPWLIISPAKIVEALNIKLKSGLAVQSRKLDRVEIEGNTLYLRLKSCTNNGGVCT